MTKLEKQVFLDRLKCLCEEFKLSFTAAKTILGSNAFFPQRDRVVVNRRKYKHRGADLEKKMAHMQQLIDEVNKVNGTNYKVFI